MCQEYCSQPILENGSPHPARHNNGDHGVLDAAVSPSNGSGGESAAVLDLNFPLPGELGPACIVKVTQLPLLLDEIVRCCVVLFFISEACCIML